MTQFLHLFRIETLNRLCQIRQSFKQTNLVAQGNILSFKTIFYQRNQLWILWIVSFYHFLDCKVFSSWISSFIEQSIIVIGCDLRQINRSSCRTPIHKPEISSTMKHIEIDRALLQNIMNSFCQFVWISLDDRFLPAVKPTIPKFHTHKWPLLVVLLEKIFHRSKILICSRSKVSSHEQILINQCPSF